MLVNKIHFQPKMQWMICTMLDFVTSVSLDIWRIERYVCGFYGLASVPFHPQWSCSLQYAYASVCWFHAFGLCCMFSKSLLITFPLFLPLQFIFRNFASILQKSIFEPVQVPHQSFVSTAKWHIISPVYRQCIKNCYLWQYQLFLFTNIRNFCNNKHNLISVWKIVWLLKQHASLFIFDAGEKPFICPYPNCGRSFTTSNIRKVHIRTHTGERPYFCDMAGCGKTFASATNYKNHIRIHSGMQYCIFL